MIIWQAQRRRIRQLVPSILGACVFSYFAYHATQGDRGIIAWWQLSDQLEDSRATLSQLVSERRRVERRVGLLRPESLDPDMLEERARVMLNFGRSDDRLLIVKDKTIPN